MVGGRIARGPFYRPQPTRPRTTRSLKNKFDRYRGGTTVPPRPAREGLSLVPAVHPELQKWRHNLTGVRVEHQPTGLTLFGAIDDLWVDHGGTHFVVDYKATSKKDEVNLADWQDGYQRQVEFYQRLLLVDAVYECLTARASSTPTASRATAAFDDVLRFRTKLIPYDGSDAWVEPTLRGVADCLASEHAPGANPECAFFAYVSRGPSSRLTTPALGAL